MEPPKEPPKDINEEFEDKSEEQYDQENEDIGREAIDKLYSDIKTQLETFNKRLVELNKILDITIETRLALDNFETKYRNPEGERINGSDERLSKSEKNAREQKDKIGDEKRANREKSRKRIVIAVLGLLVAGGVIAFLIQYTQNKEPKPTDQFTQQDVDDAKAIIEKWKSLSDDQLWENIASYADGYNPSLQTQMLMMGYIKNWANTSDFTWDATDKADLIDKLKDAYEIENKSSAIYRSVAKMTYKNTNLPRSIAADLCELALADLLAQSQEDSNDNSN
ncbi:hypothetical protein QUB80_02895 [Chlorogloeopsis sp. ULAP01]|uniref:hypothetical protein n=1 Tax=Chlorogloeopsis sp. ULAP01 TaxID=3056483 RepID=UPI0025AA939A|nr:hypothetical protein [Chlorogloeopsis sp. ULAP01]MDM9379650.1 hypothetical protein [Chlorogloeopsis sp. ULAP01]